MQRQLVFAAIQFPAQLVLVLAVTMYFFLGKSTVTGDEQFATMVVLLCALGGTLCSMCSLVCSHTLFCRANHIVTECMQTTFVILTFICLAAVDWFHAHEAWSLGLIITCLVVFNSQCTLLYWGYRVYAHARCAHRRSLRSPSNSTVHPG
jgi:hypothetical protein